MPAITYLRDCTFTIQGAGQDTGDTTPTVVGSPVTFEVDSVRIRFGNSLEDHSAGSEDYEFMRLKKKTQSIDVSKKLDVADAVAEILAANEVVVFSVTGATSSTVPEPFELSGAVAIIGDVEGEFGAPSNLNFSLNSYGVAFA